MVGQEILERFPDILPREQDSTFRQYIEAHQEEMDEEYDEAIESVKISRQIEHASGEDLDRIGRMFGPVGRRTGRSDSQYRRYLKSVVQAFSGRGTDRSMREALAAALDIRVEDIQLIEDFEDVEYEVVLHDWTPHSVSNIYEISEIVDPSGVNQSNLRYSALEADLQGVDEAVAIDGLQVLAEGFATSVGTLVQIRLQETFDESISTDATSQNITINAPSFVGWDRQLWDNFDWDEKKQFNPTTTFVLIESDIDTTHADLSTSDDPTTDWVETDELFNPTESSDATTQNIVANTTSGQHWDSQTWGSFEWDGEEPFERTVIFLNIDSDINATSGDISVFTDSSFEDVDTLSVDENNSDDRQTSSTETSTKRDANWETTSWDGFEWDGSLGDVAHSYAEDTVSVTVNEV